MTSQTTKDEYLLLFANCIPVKGISRSLIVDLQRNGMYFIDNYLYDILQECRERRWKEIVSDYDDEAQSTIEQYVHFLEENELCFWTSFPGLFPEIDLEFDCPAMISNAIIDVKEQSEHDWNDLFMQFTELGCRDIQIRFFYAVNKTVVEHILDLLRNSYIKSVEMIIGYSTVFTQEYLEGLIEEHVRIKTIYLHSAPVDQVYKIEEGTGMGNIVFTSQVIDSSDHCGAISYHTFNFSEPRTFAEYKNFNSCLNRKASIDVDGNIRNCPSLPDVYGNVRKDRVRDVINEKFKSYWNIKKDQIDICRVCEFRYVCSDCRAFVKTPGDLFSKPEKCSYDPYTMEWH